MEKHFLADMVEGEPGFCAEPWYNPHGDCIVFKSRDVAAVAQRVDDILTLYLAADDQQPVGFQLKGIRHLLRKARCNAVESQFVVRGREVFVSLSLLLFTAYDIQERSIQRRQGYAMAGDCWCPASKGEISLGDMALR